jgi:single-stranded-DNA-specific exonuclease
MMQPGGLGNQRWQEPVAVSAPVDFLPNTPVLLRDIVWRRGYRENGEAVQFLHPLDFHLPPAGSYPELTAAVDRVDTALAHNEKIAVWGDFDADGQTATAVLVASLRRLGADVMFFIPNRITDSHGLKADGLAALAAEGCRLVITCDCGTNDGAAIDFARSIDLDVVITDHHHQTGPIPRAVAVFNSSHLCAGDPLSGVPGVAMAFMLSRELSCRRNAGEDYQTDLDLVALGIIADLAPHSVANRAFLVRGLRKLWREPRPGVQALLKLIGAPGETMDTSKISFKVAPLLNAAGRLADARLGVELLLAGDLASAEAFADRLQALNLERQRLTEFLETEIDAGLSDAARDQPAIFVVGNNWHLGLIGPAASRYAARFGKPAAIISLQPDSQVARGSVRAGGGWDVLAAVASQSHLLTDWGGHAGAAGFALETKNLAAFADGFMGAIRDASPANSSSALRIDAFVAWQDLDESSSGPDSLYALIAQLAPFGEGNPSPILATRGVRFASARYFGKDGAHADLEFADASGLRRVVKSWKHTASLRPWGRYDIAYSAAMDNWRGKSRVRLTLVSARPSSPGE